MKRQTMDNIPFAIPGEGNDSFFIMKQEHPAIPQLNPIHP